MQALVGSAVGVAGREYKLWVGGKGIVTALKFNNIGDHHRGT